MGGEGRRKGLVARGTGVAGRPRRRRGATGCIRSGLTAVARRAGPPALALVLGGPLAGQDAADLRLPEAVARPSVRVVRPALPVVVDGVLDEQVWQDADAALLPWEVAPAVNGPAPLATECRFAHDEAHLYVGCRAFDPDPSSIRAFVSDRDDLQGQDRIAVLLDLFDDQRRGVEFSISPLGVQADALFSQSMVSGEPSGGERDPSWDAIWASAGRITDDGYVVEAAVPFRSLRFPPVEGERSWGIQITRWWPRGQEVQLRNVPLDRGNACQLCQTGELRGLSGIAPGRSVQVTPTLTAGRADRRSDGVLTTGDVHGDLGATLTWGVTPGVTLNATVRPDFSHVEADVAQLDVNTPVALFFPEKRPFFLEGADLFATPIRAVFTRTIADPSGGAKLSGKVGGTGFGVLVARDDAGGLLLPGVQTSTETGLGSGATTWVARVRQDVGAASTVGGLYVGREGGGGYSNRVAGADAFLQPLAPLRVRLQYLLSRTAYPAAVAAAHGEAAEPFSGAALQGQVNWSSGDWIVNGVFNSRSRAFRADAGFVPQVGTRGGNVSLHRQLWGGRDTWFSRIAMQAGTWRSETQGGELLEGDGMWMGLEYDGPGQTSLSLFPNLFYRTSFAGRTYSMTTWYAGAAARPWNGVALRLDATWGDAIDYSNARKADDFTLRPEVDLRLGRRTELRLSHALQRLSTGGRPIVTAHLLQTRAVYHFSARSFVRAIVQFRQADRDPSLHVDPVDERSRRVFGQLLYSYKLNPESVVFLGYTDDLRAVAGDRDPLALEREGRSFFLKLSYAWRP